MHLSAVRGRLCREIPDHCPAMASTPMLANEPPRQVAQPCLAGRVGGNNNLSSVCAFFHVPKRFSKQELSVELHGSLFC